MLVEDLLAQLALILVLGMTAQWLAWRLQFPSILFLLLFGFLAGPIWHFLEPDRIFGDLITPIVSLSIAIILFEGGLTLRVKELRQVGREVWLLVSVGSLVTWIVASLAAYYIVGLSSLISLLLGAILIVTGPTVIGPLLHHIRPKGKVGHLLKWEGIVIDPIGALFAVLLFEALTVDTGSSAGFVILLGVAKTIFWGSLLGIAGAKLLLILMRRFWLPDYLQEEVTLMMVILVFVASNALQHESGLFAVTLMGVLFENQSAVTIKHIVRFKENLTLLIISALFIILSARLELNDIALLNWKSAAFLLVLLLIARPLSVFLSTFGGSFTFKEKLFTSWMAPRGIVAASVASIFSLRLAEKNVPQADMLVPLTFMVIVGTVLVYGLTAAPLAWRFGLAEREPQGILMVGAQKWIRELARLLQSERVAVLLVDTNRQNVTEAAMENIPAFWGNAVGEEIEEDVDLSSLGKLFALTPNDEANSLSVLHFRELFSSSELYQLAPEEKSAVDPESAPAKEFRGRYLFSTPVSYPQLMERCNNQWQWKKTKITEQFTLEKFYSQYGRNALPLLLISPKGRVSVFAQGTAPVPQPGDLLVAFVPPVDTTG